MWRIAHHYLVVGGFSFIPSELYSAIGMTISKIWENKHVSNRQSVMESMWIMTRYSGTNVDNGKFGVVDNLLQKVCILREKVLPRFWPEVTGLQS